MKKIIILFVLFISLFVTGCSNEPPKAEEKVPANLKEITGDIVQAKLDSDGNIVIHKNDITNTVTYISYEYEGVVIGLLAVRDSNGNVRVVVNTCQSCGGSPYAYFVQVDDKLQCQSCGSLFAIDELGDLSDDGCNPISIEDLKEDDDTITIGVEKLKKLKDKFQNWKGPSKNSK